MPQKLPLGVLLFILSTACVKPAQSADEIDFTKDIRPILSDRCFACHGPDAGNREADLRLDTQDAAHEYAIVPGDANDSEVIARIFSDDADLVMPPPDSKLNLSDDEKQKLKLWVEQGAKYAKHWSFVPVAKPVVPNVGDTENPIDAFVSKRLLQLGLDFSDGADKTTLIRRLSFDITGLPPTIQEVDQFLGDESEDAVGNLVRRLLNSEKYGERMAVDWLDVARYADTHGYQNDRYRPMWPWRDWVVKAFNQNLPYDEFITWQIAGDLIPNATQDQILATAFNRNHRQTNEGGSVEEEFRAEYVADRVNTFGAAFLGLTLECARCHDHKYDPISQKEYYQLSAFFNSIDESGLYSHFTESTPTPALMLSSEEQESQIEALQQSISKLQTDLERYSAPESDFASWRSGLNDVRPLANLTEEPSAEPKSLNKILEETLAEHLIGHFTLEDKSIANEVPDAKPGKTSDNPAFASAKVGNGAKLSGDNNINVPTGGDFSRDQTFSISLWVKAPKEFERAVIFHRSRAWTDSASRGYELLIEEGRLSAALVHFWPGNAMRVVSKEKLPVGEWAQITMTYDGSSRASGLRIYLNGEVLETETVRDKLTKTIDSDPKELALGQRFRDLGFKNGEVDELRVFQCELNELQAKYLYLKDAAPANIREVLYNCPEKQLRDFFTDRHPERVEMVAKVAQARSRLSALEDSISEIMVMCEEETPRPTYVLMRGAYDAPGEQVERGMPSAILSIEDQDNVPNRRDLARWLVDPKHPLTARVFVNRIWQSFFGQGLVATSEDFGLQGSLPSHPELLDWLSADFVEHGWNVKRLITQIVTSQTYQQSSDPSPELLELDPANTQLARGPSVRLSAEMIRDSALAASGLLVDKMGGAPAKPYQPSGLWKEKSGKSYTRDKGEGSHRRSLYTYWKRTSPPPSMMTLDASNREVCVVKRQVTMTPLQVLVLLNDPQYVEAARALAAQAMQSNESTDDQIVTLFRRLVTREPAELELKVLRSLFDEQLKHFSDKTKQAEELLAVGDYSADESLDKTELAAMTVVAEGLMSYDETIMKR